MSLELFYLSFYFFISHNIFHLRLFQPLHQRKPLSFLLSTSTCLPLNLIATKVWLMALISTVALAFSLVSTCLMLLRFMIIILDWNFKPKRYIYIYICISEITIHHWCDYMSISSIYLVERFCLWVSYTAVSLIWI